MRWRDLLAELVSRLGSTEAGFVLEEVAGRSRREIVAELDAVAMDDAVVRARSIAGRVEAGEPLQHVLGSWGFRTIDLVVDRRALIPRPETEGVVERALEVLDFATGGRDGSVALDLGVGSGAIARALVSERSNLSVVGIDRSLDALGLASENRKAIGPAGDRLALVASDWFAALGPSFEHRADLIVSNPPYLSAEEWTVAPAVVRDWDPYDTLVGGPTGTEAIEQIIADAPRYLAAGASLVLEIGAAQADAVRTIGACHGAVSIEVSTDLAGRDRAVLSW